MSQSGETEQTPPHYHSAKAACEGTPCKNPCCAEHRYAELVARLAQAKAALVEAAIPLEVLAAEIPYIRHGPLRRKVKALSTEFEKQVGKSLAAIRAALAGDQQ